MRSREDVRFVDAAQLVAVTNLTVPQLEDLVVRHGLRPRYVKNHRCFDLDAVWRAIDADRAAAVLVSGEALA